MRNRSVPAQAILPHLTYQDVAGAVAWLTKTFGFSEHYRYGEPGGPVQGAQIHLGNAWLMVNSARTDRSSPAQIGHNTQSLTMFVDDVDAHFAKSKSAGAKIVEDLNETFYGERQYGVEDLEGHHWLFARHARDVSPDEWGATVAAGWVELPMAPTLANGKICYIEIPANEIGRSSEFYRIVFGWRIRQRGGGHLAFDDTTGQVSGTWVLGRPPASTPGLLVSVMVDSVAATLDVIVANGGEIVQPIGADALEITAHFRDPAGNVISLYQEPA